jgi:hypothetical protein
VRKLEREKQTPARGVVVLGGSAGAGAGREGRPLLLFLLGLGLGSGVLAAALWRQAPPAPAAAVVPQVRPAPATPPAAPPAERQVAPLQAPARSEAAPASAAPPSAPPASPAPSASASPAFTLQAVSERDGRAVAIINDRLLRDGDSIDRARVVRIAADEVELEIDGRRVVLRF